MITEPTAFVWIPGEGVSLITGTEGGLGTMRRMLEESAEETGMPIVITEGVAGIAATDPHWDGKPTFHCKDPRCGKTHDVHQMCAGNLFQRGKRRLPVSVGPNKMKLLASYMKEREAHEGVEWKLSEAFLQVQFDQGIRTFFGVTLDEAGGILSDAQQPDFFEKYQQRVTTTAPN
jgi:hypothetical protein